MNRLNEGILTVEIPLDPKYVTPDGMYMAGYIWGSHVRSPDSWSLGEREQVDKYPDFLKGVQDGYGDAMHKMKDAIHETKDDRQSSKALQDKLLTIR